MEKKAKLAVIGCGRLAQSQHIPNLSKARNAELAALCDVRRDEIERLGKYYGVDYLETDHKKILGDPSIDGVVIVTWHDTHVPLTIEALAAGKHVYVEKPLAETKEECAMALEAQKKAGKYVVVGMNRRMAPAYRYVKDILHTHGGAFNIQYRVCSMYSLLQRPPGQQIIWEICHIFDILRFFTDSDVASVYAIQARDDDEQITLKFKNGAIANILSTGNVRQDMPKEYMTIIAGQGGITVEDFVEARAFSMPDVEPLRRFPGHAHPMRDQIYAPLYEDIGSEAMLLMRRYLERADREYAALEKIGCADTPEGRRLKDYLDHHLPQVYSMNKGWQVAMEHFADLILKGGELEAASIEDGLKAAQITQAAIESRRSGKIVELS